MKNPENKIEILEIGRPNPNPKNIHGVAMVNGSRVVFNFQELKNGSLKINYVNFPQYARHSDIMPYHEGNEGHEYFCGRAIVNYLNTYGINY